MTHDYKRHGTTTLFAALNVLDGTVIGRNLQHQASGIHPLPQYHRQRSPGRQGCPCDPRQLCRPQTRKVRQWLDRHERFTINFTPTSCSWLNAVEGFFQSSVSSKAIIGALAPISRDSI
jgi:hypothetical protein